MKSTDHSDDGSFDQLAKKVKKAAGGDEELELKLLTKSVIGNFVDMEYEKVKQRPQLVSRNKQEETEPGNNKSTDHSDDGSLDQLAKKVKEAAGGDEKLELRLLAKSVVENFVEMRYVKAMQRAILVSRNQQEETKPKNSKSLKGNFLDDDMRSSRNPSQKKQKESDDSSEKSNNEHRFFGYEETREGRVLDGGRKANDGLNGRDGGCNDSTMS